MEERRTISISYKADLKDLITKLKQMPNVTEAETRRMVASLDAQLQNAEKAAREAAQASREAAEAAARAAEEAAEQFEDLEDAAEEAGSRFEDLGENVGEVEGSFGALGDTIGIFNPELGEAIQGLTDAAGAGSALLETVTSVNPALLIGASILAGLTAAFTAYTAGVEQAKEAVLELRDAQDQLQESQKEAERNMLDAASKVREMRLEYQLLTGQITEYEYNLEKAGEAAHESFTDNLNQIEDSIDNNKLLLKTLASLQKAYLGLSEAPAMTEEEMERIRLLQLQNDKIDNSINLMDRGLKQASALGHLHHALADTIAEEEQMLQAVTNMREETVNLATEMVTLEKELADATEEAEEAERRREAAIQASLEAKLRLQEQFEEDLALSDDAIKGLKLEREMQRQLNEAFLGDVEAKKIAEKEALEEQIAGLEMLGFLTGREAEAAMAAEALRHQFRMDNLEEEEEKILGLTEQQFEYLRLTHEGFTGLTSALSELNDLKLESNKIDVEAAKQKAEDLEMLTQKERDQMKRRAHSAIMLFKMEKAASIAEIAMNTAEAITKALTYGPVLGPALASVAGATGAAQMAIVAGQPAPQMQFHMGGIAPDEANARVLRGEAILDRATVRRMGGEQGVKNLQQGGSPNIQTVVIQPFKHFGRFAKDLGIQQTRKVGIQGY
jgi:hypothetical protein